MREEALAAFFKGTISAAKLARDVDGSTKRVGEIGFAIEIEDMKDELGVTSEMAIALCDAVLGGRLPAGALETVRASSFKFIMMNRLPERRRSAGR